MGFLTVFSETGIPHAGCLLEYQDGGDQEWLGFFPWATEDRHFLGGNGRILMDSREDEIEYYVRFWMEDKPLRKARNDTVTSYWSCVYQVGTCDCVSFAKDLSENCGLNVVKVLPSFIPSHLVYSLRWCNINYIQFNIRPFPWASSN
jgi:hypothetical protein